MPKFKAHPKFDNIFYTRSPKKFYTINLDRDRSVYGERLKEYEDLQLRTWDPNRSKLCAAMHLNARDNFLQKNTKVLYLGASSGTTVSHVSDICENGIVYAVEFSPRSVRELVQNCTDRENVVPILGDANHPFEYSKYLLGDVDVLYQDVAQPNQTEILMKNARSFLKEDGAFIFCIKARSIDTIRNPNEVFQEQVQILNDNGFVITDNINIYEYQTDHRVLFGIYKE